MRETEIGGQGREFPPTRWTRILSSRENEPAKREAMRELLEVYWKPLYHYARRKGRSVEAAKDAVQGFAAHLLEKEFLERLDPSRGRLRGYLRTALDHFLANEHEARSAQKRGGSARTVRFDFEGAERFSPGGNGDAALAFEREWALGVMERSLGRLRSEFEEGARRGPFDVALKFLQPGAEAPSYEAAGGECGMSAPQFKAFVHRARVRFRRIVREEVSETVADAAEVEEEVRELLRILAR